MGKIDPPDPRNEKLNQNGPSCSLGSSGRFKNWSEQVRLVQVPLVCLPWCFHVWLATQKAEANLPAWLPLWFAPIITVQVEKYWRVGEGWELLVVKRALALVVFSWIHSLFHAHREEVRCACLFSAWILLVWLLVTPTVPIQPCTCSLIVLSSLTYRCCLSSCHTSLTDSQPFFIKKFLM